MHYNGFKYSNVLRLTISVLLCGFLVCTISPSTANAEVFFQDKPLDYYGISPEDAPALEEGSGVLMDRQGNIIFSEDAHVHKSVASLTKVMTAIVAIENAPMDLQITTSERAATVGESSAHLQYGDVLTLENALYGLLLNSGNDCAIAIAECVGHYINDTHLNKEAISDEEAFDLYMAKMNETAQAIGCANTYFTNPHGLDFDEYAQGQYCTAYDMALMTKRAMEIELFRLIVSTVECEVPVYANGSEEYSCYLENSNKILTEGFQGANGVKTGYTDAALSCLSASAMRNGQEFYAVALGSISGAKAREECVEMLEWGFENVSNYEAQTTKFYIDHTPIYASVSSHDWLDKSVYATVDVPTSSFDVFPILGDVERSVSFNDMSGSILKGQVVGEITFSQNGNIIHKANLVSVENLPKPNFVESYWIETQRTLKTSKSSYQYAPNILYNL